MSKVLVSISKDYADEFEVTGFAIFKNKEWKKLEKECLKKKKPFSVSFGSNQELEFENGEDLIDSLYFKNLSKEEAKIIEKKLGKSFGFDIEYAMKD